MVGRSTRSLDSIRMFAAIAGFIFALMSVAALTRWAGLVYFAITRARAANGGIDTRRGITLAICQSLFHAGPWSVAVAIFVAYHLRTEPWAPWLFGGFALGFVLMTVAASRIAVQVWRRAHEKTNAV